MLKEKAKTEQELRDAEVPTPQTPSELKAYIASLVKREHDYGTCVYAMSMAATAAFNYVAHELGVTGFQSSCAGLDILKRTRHLKYGFRVVDYGKLLFPQYLNSEHFPSHLDLLLDNREELSKAAKVLLAEESNMVHPDVKARWEYVASMCDEVDSDIELK